MHVGHIGDRFYGSNDPTSSVDTLKEDRFIRSGVIRIDVTPPNTS